MSIFTNYNKLLSFWCKMERTANIQAPEVGGSCSQVGTIAYAAGKFGNGFRANSTSGGIDTGFYYSMEKGAIEFYWIPDNVPASQPVCGLFGPDATNTQPLIMSLYYNSGPARFRIAFYINTGAGKYFQLDFTPATIGYTSAGQLLHFAVSWDASQGSGAIAKASDIIRVWVDNTEITSFILDTAAGGVTYAEVQGQTSGSKFRWGCHAFSGGQTYAIIDNCKFYNYPKIDWSNYQVEYPLNPGIEFGKTNIFADENKKINFFCRMENLANIGKPEIGAACSESGTITYAACKFGNGFKGTTNKAGIATQFTYSMELGAIELYWKPDNVPASQPNGGLFGPVNSSPYQPCIVGFWLNSTQVFRIAIYVNTGSSDYLELDFSAATAGYTSAGQLLHIATSWDASSGSGAISKASDVLRVWVNGNEITTFTRDLVFGGLTYSQLQGVISANYLQWGSHNYINSPTSAVIDNCKYYNYPNFDFSGINVEYPLKLNGTNKFITSHEQLIAWCKAGSATEINTTEIGRNGSYSGGSFSAGKFGNAFNSNGSTNAYIDLQQWEAGDKIAGTDEITFTFWFKSNDLTQWNKSILEFIKGAGGSVYARFWTGSATTIRAFALGGGAEITVPTMSVGTWYHGAIAISKTGAQFYFEGSTLGSFISLGGGDVGQNFPWQIRYCAEQNDGAAFRLNGAIDNMKIYNYYKTDFSDRFIEGPIDLKKVVTL